MKHLMIFYLADNQMSSIEIALPDAEFQAVMEHGAEAFSGKTLALLPPRETWLGLAAQAEGEPNG